MIYKTISVKLKEKWSNDEHFYPKYVFTPNANHLNFIRDL